MSRYLINTILCSGVLLLTYHFILSKTRSFRFNRFYLLSSLVVAFLIPLISVKSPLLNANPIIKKALTMSDEANHQEYSATPKVTPVPTENEVASELIWESVLLTVYFLTAGILVFCFCFNLFKVVKQTRKPVELVVGDGLLILLDKPVTPHSFFRYIFLSADDYKRHGIQPEIICHELAHARELHSIDILIAELLQAICWFNPFIVLYRYAIRLNHEFIADATVVDLYEDKAAYQTLILYQSAVALRPESVLSSEFNYKTIKKRLTMLNSKNSGVAGLVRQLAVVPVVAVTTLLFCQCVNSKNVSPVSGVDVPATDKVYATSTSGPWVYKTGTRPAHADQDAPANVLNEYAAILAKNHISVEMGLTKKINVQDRNRLHTLFAQMSPAQQDMQFVRFVNGAVSSQGAANSPDRVVRFMHLVAVAMAPVPGNENRKIKEFRVDHTFPINDAY